MLEIGGHAAGFCGRLFVQEGYEVIRVESAPVPGWTVPEALDLYLHAGKQRELGSDPDRLRELAAAAEIVILEAGTADEVTASGFDGWAAPVKVAVTPFGRTGPKRNWRAAPNVLLAMGGYTNLMGDPGRAPLTLPGHYVEFQSGGLAYTAANACRLAGEANSVDIGMLETVMALSQFTTVMWHCGGRIRSRHGNDFWSVPPTNLFRCADGWLYINIVPGFWDAFATAIGLPELVLDDRFLTNELRMTNRDALHGIIAAAVAPLTRDEMLRRASEFRFPLGVVLDFDEVLANEHLAERGVWQRVVDPAGRRLRSPRPGWVIHGESPEPRALAEPSPQGGARFAGAPDGGDGTPAAPSPRAGEGICRGPLNGVRILDLTHVWAGPLATRFLADLGAAVVKIEAPSRRGPRRYGGAAPLGGWIGGRPGDEPWNANAVFVKLQRNKRSVAIDLKTEDGRDTFLELVAAADVVIENFSARAMPSLGLGYEALAEANPGIVYVTAPGYGATGPWCDRVAFGPTVEPMSGLTTVMGYGAGEPRNTAMALMDPITAVNATAAVLTALRRRQRTGEGAHVEMSLHEGGVAHCGPWLIERQLGAVPTRLGNRHPRMAPHGVYPCADEDGWIALACRGDDEWRALFELLRPCGAALAADMDFAARVEAADAIDEAIGRWSAGRRKAVAARELQAAGVPAGAVNTTPDMTADAQVRARGFFVPVEPGPTPMPGNPIKMTGICTGDWRPCPALGADNAGVLAEWLGYDAERIGDLGRRGVIADRPPA